MDENDLLKIVMNVPVRNVVSIALELNKTVLSGVCQCVVSLSKTH